MTSVSTSRRDGVSTSVAIKAPVRSVCTSNITASGLSAISTIDGSLTPVAGDRFLLAGQTSSVDNGIYEAATGTWARAPDFNTNREVRKGTVILTQSGLQYRLTASDPITIGTTALTFSSNDSSTLATSLASTALGAGASLVGINDAGTLITATTVEAALQEIAANNWVTTVRINNSAVTHDKVAAGMVVGYGYAESATADSTATAIPYDDTIPQITEGKEYLTLAYTPKRADSLLEVEATIPVSSVSTAAVTFAAALFRDATANAITAASWTASSGAATDKHAITVRTVVSAAAASATTFRLRYGPDSGTAYVGSDAGSAKFSTVRKTTLTVKEIKQ